MPDEIPTKPADILKLLPQFGGLGLSLLAGIVIGILIQRNLQLADTNKTVIAWAKQNMAVTQTIEDLYAKRVSNAPPQTGHRTGPAVSAYFDQLHGIVPVPDRKPPAAP